MLNADMPVGVFDSGVGGVSVLRNMAQILPHEKFIYYGDNKNAPYGVREESEIRALALAASDFLISRGIKALVIACNTATSAAVDHLRLSLNVPIVGMEPALKPAAELCAGKKTLVLATPATLKQSKFRELMLLYGEDAVVLPCAGLMEFAERGEFSGDELDGYLRELLAPFFGTVFGAAVLGCTHYVFLRGAISRALPGVPLIDGNAGTAARLKHLLDKNHCSRTSGEGGVEFFTSGNPDTYLPLMRALFYAEEG